MGELQHDHDGDTHEPSQLVCGATPYDAERTQATLEFIANVPLPNGWTLDEAVSKPLSVEWHEPVIGAMSAQRNDDSADDVSYLQRQAILVWSIYTQAPWSPMCRRGAAWGALVFGVYSHRFVPTREDTASAVLNPSANFFEELAARGGVDALHETLARAFVLS